MSNKLNSISARDLSETVKKAVEKSATLKGVTAIEPSLAAIRPPIIGFILREAEAKNTSLGELNQLAANVAGSFGGSAAKAAALVHGGHVIIGFVEEPSVTVFKE